MTGRTSDGTSNPDLRRSGSELRSALPDPEIQKLLGLVAKSRRPRIHTLSPANARLEFETSNKILDLKPLPDIMKHDHAVDVSGRALRIREYRGGKRTVEGTGALLFLHGGGWVFGSIESHDSICGFLSVHSGVPVFSLEYRLAPEDVYPAALDDALAAYRWLATNNDLAIDTSRLAIAGDSAGGNLTASLSYRLGKSELSKPALQILLYPVLSLVPSDLADPSLQTGYLMERATLDWCISNYVGHQDVASDRLSPLYAEDCSRFPTTVLITAGFDLLAEQGVRFTIRLQHAGVTVEHINYPGMVHGFASLADAIPQGRDVLEQMSVRMKAFLGNENNVASSNIPK